MRKIYFYLFFIFFISFPSLAENLKQVWQDAINNSPELRQARAQNAASHDSVYEYLGTLLPQISVSGTTEAMKTRANKGRPSRQNQQGIALNLSQTIFDMSKIFAFRLQQKNALLQDISLKIAQQKTTVNAITGYFNAVSAADQLTTLQAQKKAIEKRLEMIKISVAHGLSTITDLESTQAQYDLLVAKEIAQENLISSSIDKLSTLTGKHYTSLTGLRTGSFTPKVPELGKMNIDKLSESNLSIIQTIINEDIAKTKISAADGGFMPIVDLSATKNYSSSRQTGSSRTSEQDGDNILLKVSIPLFNGGSTLARVKGAENDYVAATEQSRSAKWTMLANLRSYYHNLKADSSAVKAYQQAVKSAETAMSATNKSYDVGARTIVDVLDATTNFYNTQQQLSMARYQYIMDIVNLQATLATIEEKNVEKINQLLGPEISLNITADFE